MLNLKFPHSQSDIFQNGKNPQKNKTAHGDVWQDKSARQSERTASPQPVRSHTPMRSDAKTTKNPRSQNPLIATGPKVPFTMWVEPIVKAEVLRRAALSGGEVSPSQAGNALLKRGIQTDLDVQYGALLTPAFESILKRYMTARDNRLASLLVRACIAIEQTRSIAVNVLGRQPSKTPNPIRPDVLNDILDHSWDDAKRKITNHSPELKELIRELTSYLLEQEK
jgi:hypothetical protein